MKVKHLVAALLKTDQELDVCVFEDHPTPLLLEDVGVFDGDHQIESNKLVVMKDTGPYVGLGSLGNYDYHHTKSPIQELYPESA
jgi:hypothetical protein